VKQVGLAAFGWLVPGGAYLLTRRYLQFAFFAVVVCSTFAAGLALQGGLQWPQPADLQGIDTFTAVVFRAGAAAKLLAGFPALIGLMTGSAHTFLEGRVHEFGTALLTLAGLFNLLAISNALELRKAEG
jgi:hypothetical protein